MVLVLKKGASKKELLNIEKKLGAKKVTQLSKYIGKIKITEDALLIQKKLRNEWE